MWILLSGEYGIYEYWQLKGDDRCSMPAIFPYNKTKLVGAEMQVQTKLADYIVKSDGGPPAVVDVCAQGCTANTNCGGFNLYRLPSTVPFFIHLWTLEKL